MKCDNCSKESQWLEYVGNEVICRKCISKHKLLAFILRSHMDTFRFVLRTLKVDSYDKLKNLNDKEIEKIVDIKKLKKPNDEILKYE